VSRTAHRVDFHKLIKKRAGARQSEHVAGELLGGQLEIRVQDPRFVHGIEVHDRIRQIVAGPVALGRSAIHEQRTSVVVLTPLRVR
jgi:hypothetical protein